MDDYYENQAGTGIATYAGLRFQKGHGFMGRFFKGIVFPLIKKAFPHIATMALASANDIAKDVKEGKNFKSAARSSVKRNAIDLAEKGLKELKGNGRTPKRQRLSDNYLF